MKKVKFKKNNGFAASDALIAIVIITIFTGLISTISYNIYLSNASLKRMSKANNYIIDVFEHVDKMYYEDVNEENLTAYVNEKYKNEEVQAVNSEETEVQTPFKFIIKVQKYNEMTGNEGKLDLVKEITATVKYKLGNREQIITMKKSKNRERVITPNKPDLSLIQLNNGENVYSVKEKNGEYVVCSEDDETWYNYKNNNYAVVTVTSANLKIGDNVEESYKKYKWIPRYAQNIENSTDIKYLFSNTNKYIEEQNGYEKLVDIGTNYAVGELFKNGLLGVWEEI